MKKSYWIPDNRPNKNVVSRRQFLLTVVGTTIAVGSGQSRSIGHLPGRFCFINVPLRHGRVPELEAVRSTVCRDDAQGLDRTGENDSA